MEILAKDRYKDSTSDDNNQTKKIIEVCDRLDCVQRSQVYVHNHIDEVATKIDAKIDARLRVITDVLKVLLQHKQSE
jgi:hypothetical protein